MNKSLVQEVRKIREVARCEQKKSRMLEHDLTKIHKHIRILNGRSKNLDQILSMG